MEAQLTDLISNLSDFKDKVVSLGDINMALSRRKEELANVEAKLANAKNELAKVQSGITVSQLKNVKEHDETIFAKRKELEGLAVKIAAAQQTLSEAKAQTAAASIRHDQIAASIESLRKKIG